MILFFDTETTGFLRPKLDLLDPAQPRCVQLAATLTDDNGQVLHSFASIIRPDGFTIPPQVAEIHGITQELALALGVCRKKAFSHFGELVRLAKRCVAHNFDYDHGIMQIESARVELEGGAESFTWRPLSYFCTMKETTALVGARKANGAPKWPKLQELHVFLFGHEFENAHSASADVEATIRCYFELKRRGLIT